MRFASNGAIAGWWQKDPRAAEEYVASHLESGPNQQLAPALASLISNSDPKHAIEWASQLPSVDARRSADDVIVKQLSWTDPKAASEWAASLPPDVRQSALQSAVGSWSQGNPEATARWLIGLSGAARDEAAGIYSVSVADRDPVVALTWGSSITDSALRDKSVEQILTGWLQRSPNDATAWIQNSGLSEEQKKRLLPPPPGR